MPEKKEKNFVSAIDFWETYGIIVITKGYFSLHDIAKHLLE